MASRVSEAAWLVAGATALVAAWSFALGRPIGRGAEPPPLQAPLIANGSGTALIGGATDNVTVLEFFASWCGTCARSVPGAERVALGNGARWIAVSVDDSPDDAVAAARRWHLGGAVVHDQARKLSDAYQVQALPTVVVLRQDGSVASSAVGALSDGAITERIDEARRTGTKP